MEVNNTLITLPDPIKAVFFKLAYCTSRKLIEKRSITHFMFLLLKKSSITIIIALEYMPQAQSLIYSWESQKTIAVDIEQFVYLIKSLYPELGDLLYSLIKVPSDQRPSSCIVKLLEQFFCELKIIHIYSLTHTYNPQIQPTKKQ